MKGLKGLKNVTALAESGAVPSTAMPTAVAEPIQTGTAVAPTTGPAPTTAATSTQPPAETFPDRSSGEIDTARVEQEELVEGEKAAGGLEQERQQEPTSEVEPPQIATAPRARSELLLDLIRSFRRGMLRVDSNLRGTMFRCLRYLVSVFVSKSANVTINYPRSAAATQVDLTG